MTKKEELLQRIEDLERRVRDLEARPLHVPVPVQPVWPHYPSTGDPFPLGPIVTCDGVSVGTVTGTELPYSAAQ